MTRSTSDDRLDHGEPCLDEEVSLVAYENFVVIEATQLRPARHRNAADRFSLTTVLLPVTDIADRLDIDLPTLLIISCGASPQRCYTHSQQCDTPLEG